MKKTLLILCICLSVILSSCANDDIEYRIYYDTLDIMYEDGSTGNYTFYKPGLDVKIGIISGNPDFSIDHGDAIKDEGDAPKHRTLEIGGESYELEYLKTYRSPLYTLEKYQSFSQSDEYEQDKIYAEFRSGSDILLRYHDNSSKKMVVGDLTEEEAKKLAKDIVAAQYGEAVFNEYTFDNVRFAETLSQSFYEVTYTRYVHDIPTNDTIRVAFNLKGHLYFLIAPRFGMYKDAEKEISSRQIKKAIEFLTDCLSDEWVLCEDPVLMMDSCGVFYVSITAKNKGGNARPNLIPLYINVN